MSKNIIIFGILGGIIGGISYRVYEYYNTRKKINDTLKETVKGIGV